MTYGSWPFTGPNGDYTSRSYLNGKLQGTTISARGASYWGTRARYGLTTPGFHLKRMTGKLPENDFNFTEETTTACVGQLYNKRRVYANVYEVRANGIFGGVSWGTIPWNLPLLKANFANLVDAKLAAKVKDSDVDVAVFLGEIRETKAMFAGSLQNILRAARAAASGASLATIGGLLGVRWSPKTPANGWLLVQYGILPLIRDIEGAVKALEKGLLKLGYKLARARHVYTDTVTQVSGDWTKSWSLHLETSARVKYRVVNEYVSTLASLGLTNPGVLGWELLRLSFVVDWLFGVGAWLNQLDAYVGKQFDQGSRTFFVRVKCEAWYRKNSQPGYDIYWERRDQSYHYVTCDRTDLADFPFAVLPGVKDPDSLNLFHLLTSLSLLIQRR